MTENNEATKTTATADFGGPELTHLLSIMLARIESLEAEEFVLRKQRAFHLDMLTRIESLEAEMRHLENKPPQYVPPPTFGPLPRQQPYPLEIGPFKGFGVDEAEAFEKQLRDLVNRER